ncbi:MAG: VWA domain-containing protein [Actinomycetota bacterium]
MAEADRSDLDFVELLVQFGHALRNEGLSIGSGDVVTFCEATAELNPADMVDVYWAGRTTLVTRRDNIAVYNRVFRRFFLDVEEARGDERRQVLQAPAEGKSVLQVPEAEPGVPGAGDDDEVQLGLMASNAEIWRNKSFAACTPEELAALRRIMAQVRLTPPRRRTRRTVSTRQGRRIDPRRTARETMRLHGEPGDLYWRRRRMRIRPLVLILDVSGSMSDYSRNLLQFSYSALRSASRVEVFCFGTRLTRVTPALNRRRPDEALEHAARTVFDWDGGTRIGDSLHEFVNRWGRRGTSRGAIVVICSDGLDRGDPGKLADAMERLARLSHKIAWMNPHQGDATQFRANTLALMVAEPYVDLFVSGHNLRSLEQFAVQLADLS